MDQNFLLFACTALYLTVVVSFYILVHSALLRVVNSIFSGHYSTMEHVM